MPRTQNTSKRKDTGGRPRIPDRLTEAVEELVDLTVEKGEFDLGHGVVLTADLKEDCRCKCSYSVFIKGPATLPPGKTESYLLATPVGHLENPGCKDCKHTDTKWEKGGNSAADVTLDKNKPLSIEVKIKATAANGTFTLTATPKGECKCKGSNAVVECVPLADTVTIEIKKS